MKLKSLQTRIQKLGGTATIIRGHSQYDNKEIAFLEGQLGDYLIAMHPNAGSDETDYYTVVKIGTEYDPGSDYNPHGYTYCRTLNSLEWACNLNNQKVDA